MFRFLLLRVRVVVMSEFREAAFWTLLHIKDSDEHHDLVHEPQPGKLKVPESGSSEFTALGRPCKFCESVSATPRVIAGKAHS